VSVSIRKFSHQNCLFALMLNSLFAETRFFCISVIHTRSSFNSSCEFIGTDWLEKGMPLCNACAWIYWLIQSFSIIHSYGSYTIIYRLRPLGAKKHTNHYDDGWINSFRGKINSRSQKKLFLFWELWLNLIIIEFLELFMHSFVWILLNQ
jgi:hypothetical protein